MPSRDEAGLTEAAVPGVAVQAVEAELFFGAEHVEAEFVPEVEGFEVRSGGGLDDGLLAAGQGEDHVAVLAHRRTGEG